MTVEARDLAQLTGEARLLQEVMDLVKRREAPPPAPLLDAVLLGTRRGGVVIRPRRWPREP